MVSVSNIESKAAALDAFRSGNMIPHDIDLSGYTEDKEMSRIKPAESYIAGTKDILFNRRTVSGTQLPWLAGHGKFAFRKGELTIWTGYKGHGKSAMLSHCLLHAMSIGDKSFIISPEFKPEDVLARKVRQASGSSSPMESFIDRWFGWASERLWLLDHQGGLQAQKVLALMRYAVDRFKVDHIVVDSLMKCGIGTDDYNRQKWFVDQLQTIAHSLNIHVHLVAHARKGDNDDSPARLHDVKGTSEIADMAENVVSVWKNKPKLNEMSMGKDKRKNEPDGMFMVDSQRNGDGWVGSIPLWFDPASLQFKDSAMSGSVRYEPGGTTREVEEF